MLPERVRSAAGILACNEILSYRASYSYPRLTSNVLWQLYAGYKLCQRCYF
jgi:hypothetical protein